MPSGARPKNKRAKTTSCGAPITWSRAVLSAYIAHHKTATLQEMLLASPRKAKEVAVVDRLMQLRVHGALPALAKETEPQSAYAVLESQVRLFAGRLGFDLEADKSLWAQFPPPHDDDLTFYEAVRQLGDHELDQLETLLSALTFGQGTCQRLDADDTLFNRVARDLMVDMRYHWHPDRSFFERRTRDQLAAIAVDCGYAEGPGRLGSYKKVDLVNALIRHFESARAAAMPTPAQQKAREWLPDAMRFPAIDPDATVEAKTNRISRRGKKRPDPCGAAALGPAAPPFF
jgi:ParB family chromosome partitioning protein